MHNRSLKNGFVLSIFTCFCVTVLCTDADKCYLNSKTKNIEQEKFLSRISPLSGQIFRTEKDGNSYVVAICSDTSKQHANVSVTKSNSKGDTVTLGRRNETYLDGGDTWILLHYDCGDHRPNSTDSQCLGHPSASIYIICDPKKHDKFPNIKLTEAVSSHYTFILPSISICQHEEEVSGSTVFFIVLAVAFFAYFIIGIVYRRLVQNAQGCQQLPHFHFWQRVGGLLADGCNYIFRCNDETETSWNNITNNFDSGDRDDALLRT